MRAYLHKAGDYPHKVGGPAQVEPASAQGKEVPCKRGIHTLEKEKVCLIGNGKPPVILRACFYLL